MVGLIVLYLLMPDKKVFDYKMENEFSQIKLCIIECITEDELNDNSSLIFMFVKSFRGSKDITSRYIELQEVWNERHDEIILDIFKHELNIYEPSK